MNAAVSVVPAAGVTLDRNRGPDGRLNGSGIAHTALCTADALDGPADLIILAVPAGHADKLAASIVRKAEEARP